MIKGMERMPSKGPARIFLIGDQEIFRLGIRYLLEQQTDCQIVGETALNALSVREVLQSHPDLIIADLVSQGGRMPDHFYEIRGGASQTCILICTSKSNHESFHPFLREGLIEGCVLREEPVDVVLNAVKTVLSGRMFFAQDDDAFASRIAQRDRPRLTRREEEILQLVASGKKNREISEELCISTRTVEKHREHVMHKLGLRTVQELTRYALSRGLIRT